MLGDTDMGRIKNNNYETIKKIPLLAFYFFGSLVFIESMIFLAPLQYLFTGKTTWVDNLCDRIDNIANKINPDK